MSVESSSLRIWQRPYMQSDRWTLLVLAVTFAFVNKTDDRGANKGPTYVWSNSNHTVFSELRHLLFVVHKLLMAVNTKWRRKQTFLILKKISQAASLLKLDALLVNWMAWQRQKHHCHTSPPATAYNMLRCIRWRHLCLSYTLSLFK